MTLTRDEIRAALESLAQILERRGVTAQIHVVGGAAMVLAYNARTSTNDVDATFYPTDDVSAAAREVADRLGLPADWLNDSVKIYVPIFGEAPTWNPVVKLGAVEIAIADPRTLLAMKLRASRAAQDRDDIELLCRVCDVRGVKSAVTLYESYFPEDPLPERAVPLLKAIFSTRDSKGSRP
jgi:hypothetical protein